MTERELSRELTRLIRGELSSADVRLMAERAGFQSFAELCESELPEELERIEISTHDVVTRIDRQRKGEIDLSELWRWADELYNISFNHRIAYESEREDQILTALSVMSVVCNQRLFPVKSRSARALEHLRASLSRGQDIELRRVFERAFEGLPVAHLATKEADEDDDEEDEDGHSGLGEPDALAGLTESFSAELEEAERDDRFADVVLLDAPYDPSRDIASGYSWVIAFSVITRELYFEELAEAEEEEAQALEDAALEEAAREIVEPGGERAAEAGGEEGRNLSGQPGGEGGDGKGAPKGSDEPGSAQRARQAAREVRAAGLPPARRSPRLPQERPPEVAASRERGDRIPYLMRLVPNFGFAKYQPMYVCDGDGIAEIVLDAPSIGPNEVRYAAKLFGMNNRVGRVLLNGEPVKTLCVRPLGEKRRRRKRPGPCG